MRYTTITDIRYVASSDVHRSPAVHSSTLGFQKMRQRKIGQNDGILPYYTPSEDNGVRKGQIHRRRRKRRRRVTRDYWRLAIAVTIFGIGYICYKAGWYGKGRNKREAHDLLLGEKIQCGDGSFGILNDDYCDCMDGADEPLTSACSHVLVQKPVFECRDQSNTLFASRLHDGVKDCADGTDEMMQHQKASFLLKT